MAEEARKQKIAIIVKSDTYEDLVLALGFAGIAVNSGIPASMFFTSRGARLLRKGGLEEVEEKDLDPLGEVYRDRCMEMVFSNLGDMIRDLKSKGTLWIYLCTRGVKAWASGKKTSSLRWMASRAPLPSFSKRL